MSLADIQSLVRYTVVPIHAGICKPAATTWTWCVLARPTSVGHREVFTSNHSQIVPASWTVLLGSEFAYNQRKQIRICSKLTKKQQKCTVVTPQLENFTLAWEFSATLLDIDRFGPIARDTILSQLSAFA